MRWINEQITSGVSNTETFMADNEDLDPPPPQYILNLFVAADLSSRSSSDSDKYKHVCLKAKVISYTILYAGECPDVCGR